MAEWPSGLVTFVFTDIEGSTALLRSNSTLYPALLDQHHECLRTVWSAHGGVEVGTEGDAFFVAFATAGDAVRAVVAAQQALARVDWVVDDPVRVRMGAHSGYAQPRHGDYVALAVHQAARIVSAAHGGQILVSDDTAELAGVPPPGVQIVSLGRFQVRDFERPVTLYEVRGPGIEPRSAMPRVRPADGHNLLPPTSALLGRDDDLRSLTAVVAPHAAVTIVGPGGIGKTRLAIEHGLRTVDAWSDGVWFCDLATVTNTARLDDTVAAAIGATAVPGRETRQDIVEHLRQRNALLILDNCEHLGSAPAALVRAILDLAPEVGILATSRSPLGLHDETLHRLSPLPARTGGAPATRLFRERAGTLRRDDLPVVADLCEALDGLPLAIELAAARARTVSPQTLLERIGSSLELIGGGDPTTLPDRQRTMERTLSWSYDLLDPGARRLLGRLAAFARSADLDTVLLAWPEDGDLATIEQLHSLIDSSLIERDTTVGETRFRVPATVRTYMLSRSDPTELQRAARAAASALAMRIGPQRAAMRRWISDLGVELDNLRQLLALLGDADAALAQSLAWCIGQYHDVVRAFATGVSELGAYAAQLTARTPARIALLTQLADLELRADDVSKALPHLRSAIELHREGTDLPEWDDSCIRRTEGEILLKRGEFQAAVELAAASLAEIQTPRGRARILNLRGLASAGTGDLVDAVEAFTEELDVVTSEGFETFVGITHGNLAEALYLTGDLGRAADHQRRALEEARSNGDVIQIAFSLVMAARIQSHRGAHADAAELERAARHAAQRPEFAEFAKYAKDDMVVESARTALGDAVAARAAARGETLTLDAAADRAEAVLVGGPDPATTFEGGEPV